jgi:hypothetical protein
MSNLMSRLDKLEHAIKPEHPRRVIRIVRDEDEPMAAAIERWCAAHPGEPPPSPDDDNALIIMRTIVSPKPSSRVDCHEHR